MAESEEQENVAVSTTGKGTPKTLTVWARKRFVVGADCGLGEAHTVTPGTKLKLPYKIGRRLLDTKQCAASADEVPGAKRGPGRPKGSGPAAKD